MRKYVLTPMMIVAGMLIILAGLTVLSGYQLDIRPGRLNLRPGATQAISPTEDRVRVARSSVRDPSS